jgi:hypothetical protein
MFRKTVLTAFAILVLAGLSAAGAAEIPASVKALIPAAQKEGVQQVLQRLLRH